jgi:hypothetical protein
VRRLTPLRSACDAPLALPELIRSEYREIPGPHRGKLLRELFSVFEGRFCFPLGLGIRCGGPTSFTITAGETRSVEFGFTASVPIPGSPGLNINRSIEYTHTFSQAIGPWEVGECDSMYPVLCVDNAQVRVWRSRIRIRRRYALSAFTEEFDPCGNRGWVDKNAVRNDAECGCHNPAAPTTIDTAHSTESEDFPVIQVVRPTALLPVAAGTDHDDPQAAAQETVDAIVGCLGWDDEAPSAGSIAAITRTDGVAIWLTGLAAPGVPNLALLPSGLSSLPRRIVTFDRDLVPVVAVGPAGDAVRCEVTILARSPEGDELQMATKEEAAVRSTAGIIAVWYEANLAEWPPERSGIVELQLYDSSDRPVGYPVREPFVIDPLSQARELARA